jgi:hypothetical protein
MMMNKIVYKGLNVVKHDERIQARSIEKELHAIRLQANPNILSEKTFSQYVKLKRAKNISENDSEAWIKINAGLPNGYRGWYIKEEYVDDYIKWIVPDYDFNQNSDDELKPIVTVKPKPRPDYILWIGLYNEKKHAKKGQIEINVCKRRKYGFKLVDKNKEGECLYFREDVKEDLVKLRHEIVTKLEKLVPNRIYVPHTQGSRIIIPEDKLNAFKEVLESYIQEELSERSKAPKEQSSEPIVESKQIIQPKLVNNGEYGLLIHFNESDSDNDIEIHIHKRKNYKLINDSKLRDIITNKKYSLYHIDDKESILAIRRTIIKGIGDRGIQIRCIDVISEIEYVISKDDVDNFKELMKTYNELISKWVEGKNSQNLV